MKNKFLLYGLPTVIFSLFLYGTLIPILYSKKIELNEPYTKVGVHLVSLKNLAKWYLPFANSDTNLLKYLNKTSIQLNAEALEIKKTDGITYTYEIAKDESKMDIFLQLIPDSGKKCTVLLYFKNTWWNEHYGAKKEITSQARKSLENLKEYFSDSKKMYGFSIEVTSVSDTAFLFCSDVVARTQKKEKINNLYKNLIQEASQKEYGYTGVRIFYSSPIGNDSIHLFTAIGVAKNIGSIPLNGKYSLKKMPDKLNLLTTYYQGKFGKVNDALLALQKFREDNSFVSMAIPFIKFDTEGTEFSDEQIVQVTAYYPIF